MFHRCSPTPDFLWISGERPVDFDTVTVAQNFIRSDQPAKYPKSVAVKLDLPKLAQHPALADGIGNGAPGRHIQNRYCLAKSQSAYDFDRNFLSAHRGPQISSARFANASMSVLAM